MKLSALYATSARAFTYMPPAASYGTVRVLVVIGETVRAPVLKEVLRGLWRYTPHTRVLITDHPALEPERMLGANMAVVDLDTLPLRPYLSPLVTRPVNGSTLLSDVALCISVVSVEASAPLAQSPSLAVMRGLAPAPVSAHDAYFTLGATFGGAVVDTGERVHWGDDPLEVDLAVYRALGQPPDPALTDLIAARRNQPRQD